MLWLTKYVYVCSLAYLDKMFMLQYGIFIPITCSSKFGLCVEICFANILAYKYTNPIPFPPCVPHPCTLNTAVMEWYVFFLFRDVRFDGDGMVSWLVCS